jgi:hypothetical protein
MTEHLPHSCRTADHHGTGGMASFRPAPADLLRAGGRRWFLQTGLAGLAGVPLAASLANAATGGGSKKSVIVFWLSGGPSHIDMWDPKPDASREIRGPFGSIETKVPGLRLCEHLPLQASIADKLSILRAVDCKESNHTPITMQAGNPFAKRSDNGKDGDGWPSMGSVAAKFRGPNHPQMPAFVGLAPSWKADVYESGYLGSSYDPLKGLELVGKFGLPEGIAIDRLRDRSELRGAFDRFRSGLDRSEMLTKTDASTRAAYEMVASGYVQNAFDLSKEQDSLRDHYGRNSVGEKALLARRLVEAGVSYVLVSGAWGYFDHHGDDVPPWGGIEKGLKPLLPQVDRALFGLVTDLEQRGLLDDTLVVMMGEFGRAPMLNKGAGRDHWTNVMSLVMAGGGLRHGQAIGATDSKGGGILHGAVRPQDLAATVFRHLEIDLRSEWTNPQGRPMPIVVEGGRPVPELFG